MGRLVLLYRQLGLSAFSQTQTSGGVYSDVSVMLGSRLSLEWLAGCVGRKSLCGGRGNVRSGSGAPFPPITLANAAGLLDVEQVSKGQTVIRHGVFACGLQAMLRDGSTDLIALAGVWSALRVALGR